MAEQFRDTGSNHPIDAGSEQKQSSLLDAACNDVLKPLANSALIQPYDTVAHTVNAVTDKLTGHKLLSEVDSLHVTAAKPYTAEWAAQSLSSGLGAIVPYTIAGKAAGGMMRGVGARLEVEGATAALLKSEQAAFIGGAFAYDGLRTPGEGETRLGNALGGAAGFYVFGKGNELSRSFTPAGKLAARVATGFLGADTSLTVSHLYSQHSLASADEYLQAGLSGAMMNSALPTAQDFISKRVADYQSQTERGAPADRYARFVASDADNNRSQTLNQLLYHNPWARVTVGSEFANYDASNNHIQVQEGRNTRAVIARELAHIENARQVAAEGQYQQASSALQGGRTEEAWQQFRSARAAEETQAHAQENQVNNQLHGSHLLPHLDQEISAWPAPGGVSYETKWRQEFNQFAESGGKWRPGQSVNAENAYDPNLESAKQTRDLTESEKQSLAMQEQGTSLVRDLYKAGFIAVFAGGSVRDEAMGLLPKDYDIATSAPPDVVEKLFADRGYKVIPTGKQFGVINVIANGHEFEIATLRNDGNYTDGRRPDSVKFVGSLWEDAARRDLTINAMFKDPTTGVRYDFFGGNADIANKQIRTVGDPGQRFQEDALRMMRIPRFAATKGGFTVAPETQQAITEHAPDIAKVSAERVRDEMKKMLTGKDPNAGLNIMMDTGLMRAVLPEVADTTSPRAMQDPVWHPEGSVWNHTRMMLNVLKGSRFELMFATLLHDIGKPDTQKILETGRITNYGHAEVGADMARDIANRLKLTNAEKDRVVKLVADHMKMHTVPEWRQSRLHDLFTSPYFDDHVALQHADAVGTGRPDGMVKSQRDWLTAEKAKADAIDNPAQQLGAKPIVDGRFLIAAGVKPGPRMGEIKNAALEAQREGAFDSAETAQKWLEQNVREFQKH